MKSLLASGLAALALSSLVGCAESPTLSSTAGVSYEEYLAAVDREPGTGGYILDWDVVVFDEAQVYESWQRSQQGALSIYRQAGADIKWTDAAKKNLTYCVSDAFGARKATVIAAMQAAGKDGWEKFGDIKFKYDPTQDATCTAANNAVVFDVNPINGAPYLARAFFPNSPRGERNVIIETAAFDPGQTNGISFTNILIHELGHVLGFRHEHIARPGQAIPGCVEDNQYRIIGTYDQASTMHYPQCGSPGNTLALSDQDKTGVAIVYGPAVVNVAPMAMVNSPADGASVSRNFSVDAAVVDENLAQVELFVDGQLIDTKVTGPFIFDLVMVQTGIRVIEVVATDTDGLITTQELSVNVRSGGGNGDGSGGGDPVDDSTSTDVTGGCSAAGGSGAGLGFVLVALVGLVGRGRRRRA